MKALYPSIPLQRKETVIFSSFTFPAVFSTRMPCSSSKLSETLSFIAGNFIKELLNEEIAAEIQAISSLDSGSEKKSKAIEDLAKLYRLRIEESKNELDAEDKRSRRTLESEASIREHEIKQSQLDEQIKADVQDEQFKSCQLNEQMKDRYFKVGIAAAELLIPLMFYGIWMRKGFKFEETGTYTSTTFRGLFNRFRPTKK